MTTALGSGDGGQGNATPPPTTGNPPPGNTPPPTTPPGTASWRDTLPDDLKNDVGLQQFQSVENLAKSWRSAQDMVGKKGVVVPGEKATDEEWKSFYKSLGQPDADKYSLTTPKETPTNAEFLKGFKETVMKGGLLPKQAQAVLDFCFIQEQTAIEAGKKAFQTQTQEALKGLKTEWGQGYDKQVGFARAAVKEFGTPEDIAYLNESGMGDNPHLIKMLAKAGALLGEDRIRGDGGSGKFGKTPQETQREINDIMGNTAHPYFDTNHPGHAQAVKDMELRYKAMSQTA